LIITPMLLTIPAEAVGVGVNVTVVVGVVVAMMDDNADVDMTVGRLWVGAIVGAEVGASEGVTPGTDGIFKTDPTRNLL
jgi:hypothetical protein